jgi:hypothetical protein
MLKSKIAVPNMAISWLISEVLIKNPQKAYKIMQDELTRRGLLPVINQQTTTTGNSNPYKKAYDPDIKALDFQPTDIFFI